MRTITVKAWAPVENGKISPALIRQSEANVRASLPFGYEMHGFRILPVTITCEVPEDE